MITIHHRKLMRDLQIVPTISGREIIAGTEMSDGQDQCPCFRQVFEIICVKFVALGARTVSWCPNCPTDPVTIPASSSDFARAIKNDPSTQFTLQDRNDPGRCCGFGGSCPASYPPRLWWHLASRHPLGFLTAGVRYSDRGDGLPSVTSTIDPRILVSRRTCP